MCQRLFLENDCSGNCLKRHPSCLLVPFLLIAAPPSPLTFSPGLAHALTTMGLIWETNDASLVPQEGRKVDSRFAPRNLCEFGYFFDVLLMELTRWNFIHFWLVQRQRTLGTQLSLSVRSRQRGGGISIHPSQLVPFSTHRMAHQGNFFERYFYIHPDV